MLLDLLVLHASSKYGDTLYNNQLSENNTVSDADTQSFKNWLAASDPQLFQGSQLSVALVFNLFRPLVET